MEWFGIGIYEAKHILELAQGNGELAIKMAKVQTGKEMLHLTEMLKTPTDDQRILNLERENADLRLQLERGVKLHEELAKALEDWFDAREKILEMEQSGGISTERYRNFWVLEFKVVQL